jgi:uncharacterized membrane protein
VAAAPPLGGQGVRRREDLTTPRRARRIGLGIHYDPDAFGEFSEGIARFFGTARFLVIQTIVVIIWIGFNLAYSLNIGDIRSGLDPYPFILLNLVFSTQAAYAAPLILLAQNRQEARDRAETERDRDRNARMQADTEFLAREIASIRLALSDMITADELDERLEKLAALMTDRPPAAPPHRD